MTKKDAKARKLAWNNSIREGRMAKFTTKILVAGIETDHIVFRQYSTPELAQRAVAAAPNYGETGNIVPAELAQ